MDQHKRQMQVLQRRTLSVVCPSAPYSQLAARRSGSLCWIFHNWRRWERTGLCSETGRGCLSVLLTSPIY